MQSASFLKPINESASSLKPINESASSLKPINESASSLKPINEGANSLKPINESASSNGRNSWNPWMLSQSLDRTARKNCYSKLEWCRIVQ
jgi:hypothetical protein